MTETLWDQCDLPVLTDIHRYLLPGGSRRAKAEEVAERTGLEVGDVGQSIIRLRQAGYIQVESGMPPQVVRVTPTGLQALGEWPTPGDPYAVVQALFEGLDEVAAKETDPEKRSRLQQAATHLGGIVKDVGVNVFATVIARAAGIG